MMHAGRSDARMQSSATRLSRLITSAARQAQGQAGRQRRRLTPSV